MTSCVFTSFICHPGSEIKLRKLVMEIKDEDGERFYVTLERNWKNVMELWAKKKCQNHASAVESHLLAWS